LDLCNGYATEDLLRPRRGRSKSFRNREELQRAAEAGRLEVSRDVKDVDFALRRVPNTHMKASNFAELRVNG
jgi:hypothetical protein